MSNIQGNIILDIDCDSITEEQFDKFQKKLSDLVNGDFEDMIFDICDKCDINITTHWPVSLDYIDYEE